jgi:hypothetical protein
VAGLAVASAMMSTSEGPASMSIAHTPATSDLAAVTHLTIKEEWKKEWGLLMHNPPLHSLL